MSTVSQRRTLADLKAQFENHARARDLFDLLDSILHLDASDALFHATTGHLHTAAAGAGPVLTGAALATGIVRTAVVDGVNENAADVTVTGMVAGDEIVSVLVLTTKAAIATMALRAAGDFVPGAGVMVSTANKADNTNNQYLITWVDHTP